MRNAENQMLKIFCGTFRILPVVDFPHSAFYPYPVTLHFREREPRVLKVDEEEMERALYTSI